MWRTAECSYRDQAGGQGAATPAALAPGVRPWADPSRHVGRQKQPSFTLPTSAWLRFLGRNPVLPYWWTDITQTPSDIGPKSGLLIFALFAAVALRKA